MIYTISCYIGPRYNDTALYIVLFYAKKEHMDGIYHEYVCVVVLQSIKSVGMGCHGITKFVREMRMAIFLQVSMVI